MSNKKTLRYEDVLQLHDDSYDPADNRTYQCPPLCSSPTQEIKAHLALSGYGTGSSAYTTTMGSFFGHSSVQFDDKVDGMVLHFPKASDFTQLKLIKHAKLPSLYPSWIIERYSYTDKVQTYHKVPVFYDTNVHEFLVPLDIEFFTEFSPQALKMTKLPNFRTMSDKSGRTNGFFTAATYKELTDVVLKRSHSEESPFSLAKKVYRRHFLNAANGERVICVGIKHREGNAEGYKLLTGVHSASDRDIFQQLVRYQTASFELYQGALIEDTVYLMEDDGTLHPNAMALDVKTRKQRAATNPTSSLCITDKDYTYYTIPYSADDWNLLVSIHERLHNLMTDLEGFFASGARPNERHDRPLSELKAAPAFLGLHHDGN